MIAHSSEQEIMIEQPGLGLITDREIDNRLVPDRAWTAGRNIRFYSNASKVKKSDSVDLFDTTTGSAHIRQLMKHISLLGVDTLVRVGLSEAWKNAGPAVSIGAGLTGTADDIVSWDQYENLLIWTDKKDRPKRWDGAAAAFSNHGGLSADFRAKIVRAFKNHVLFFNIVDTGIDAPWRMVYSATGTPEIFTGATSGSLDMVTTPGGFVTAEVHEDTVLAFKEKAIHRVSFVGLPLNFVNEVVSTEDGCISARGAIRIGPYVYYVGNFNFYRIATQPEPIGNPIWEEFLTRVDLTKRNHLFAYHRPEFREVIWRCRVPGDAQPSLEFAYNYDENTWAMRDANLGTSFIRTRDAAAVTGDTWDAGDDGGGDTWDGGAAIPWDDLTLSLGAEASLYSDASGNIWSYRVTGTQDGSYTAYVESKIFHLGALNASRIIRIPIICRGTGTLRVMARAWDDEREATPPFVEVGQYTLGSSRRPWVDVRLWGRLAQIRFENLAGADDWQLEMYGIKHIPGAGER